MNDKLLDELTINDLAEDQREIAECIGIEAYKVMIKTFNGSYLYIQKEETILVPIRNKHLKKEFDGGNYTKLARKYRLSESSVRRIINS